DHHAAPLTLDTGRRVLCDESLILHQGRRRFAPPPRAGGPVQRRPRLARAALGRRSRRAPLSRPADARNGRDPRLPFEALHVRLIPAPRVTLWVTGLCSTPAAGPG